MNDSTHAQIDEASRRAFESAWESGNRPVIDDFLPSERDASWLPTLAELVLIDMEYLWKNGPATEHPTAVVENYVERYPALNVPERLRELIEQEYHVRRSLGDSVTPEEYMRRFPNIISKASDLPHAGPDKPSGGMIAEAPGDVISGYKLLEVIGEGGFGVVYMAEQFAPIRRKVAFKIIKPGMDSRDVIARFEAERQALAMMEHECIARVFDAGQTDTGRPYFVMELVHGLPITKFCDRNKLDTHARLNIFVQTCRAVQHAHQKGVIHRDLKPSNVMVTLHDGTPLVKVIDFGIAKATAQPLTEKTLFTHYGQVIGTPQYMSPEQAQMSHLDVDTRSDVYSLGVILYELLTGTTPLERDRLQAAALDDMLRLIREEEPPTPSSRVSRSGEALADIADRRSCQPRRLGLLMRGDLDWIVMKALEKDRTRRYDGPGELARDVARYLDHEPVLAGPPSAVYKLRRFAAKHRKAVLTASAFLLVLVLTTVFSVWQAWEAGRQRDAKDLALTERNAALEKEKATGRLAQQRLEEARTQRRKAEIQSRRSESHRLSVIAKQVGTRTPLTKLLLAANAVNTTQEFDDPPVSAAVEELYAAMSDMDGFGLGVHGERVRSMRFSDDSRWLITADDEGAIVLWDLRSTDPAANGVAVRERVDVKAADTSSARSLTDPDTTWQLVDGRWLVVEESEPAALVILDLLERQPLATARRLAEHRLPKLTDSSLEWRELGVGSHHILTTTAVPRNSPLSVDPEPEPGAHEAGLPIQAADINNTIDLHICDLRTGATRKLASLDTVIDIRVSPDRHWLFVKDRFASGGLLCDISDDTAVARKLSLPTWNRTVEFSGDSRWLLSQSLHDFDLLLHPLEDPAQDDGAYSSIQPRDEHPANADMFRSVDDHWLVVSTSRVWTSETSRYEVSLSAPPVTTPVGGPDNPDSRISLNVTLWDLTASDPSSTVRSLTCDELQGPHRSLWKDQTHRWLLIDGGAGSARLFDLADDDPDATSRRIALLPHSAEPTRGVVDFSPDGRFLVAQTDINQFSVLDLLDGSSERPVATIVALASTDARAKTFCGNSGDFPLFSSDNRHMAVLHPDGNVVVYDLRKRVTEVAIIETTARRSADIPAEIFTFSPQGKWLVASASERADRNFAPLRLWDTRRWSAEPIDVRTRTGDGLPQFSPQERWIVESGPRLGEHHDRQATDSSHFVTANSDSRTIDVAASGRVVRVWDLQDGVRSGELFPMQLIGHDDAVRRLRFSDNEELLVTASRNESARVWDLVKDVRGACPLRIDELGAWPTKQGLLTMSALSDGTRMLRLRDDRSGKTVGAIACESGDALEVVAVDPAGQWVVADSRRETPGFFLKVLRLNWTDETMQQTRLTGHQAPVLTEQFSLDGRWLVTGDDDGKVQVWALSDDAVTCKEELDQFAGGIREILHSHDSRDIFVSDGQTARCWRLRPESPAERLWDCTVDSVNNRMAETLDGRRPLNTMGGNMLVQDLDTNQPSLLRPNMRSTPLDPDDAASSESIGDRSESSTFASCRMVNLDCADGRVQRWSSGRRMLTWASTESRPVPRSSNYGHLWNLQNGTRHVLPLKNAVATRDLQWILGRTARGTTELWSAAHEFRNTPLHVLPGTVRFRRSSMLVTMTTDKLFVWDLSSSDPTTDPHIVERRPLPLKRMVADERGRKLTVLYAGKPENSGSPNDRPIQCQIDVHDFGDGDGDGDGNGNGNGDARVTHEPGVTATSSRYELSNDGRWLLVCPIAGGDEAQQTVLWDLTSEPVSSQTLGRFTVRPEIADVASMKGSSSGWHFSEDGQFLVREEPKHRIWRLNQGIPATAVTVPNGLNDTTMTTTGSPDGKWVVLRDYRRRPHGDQCVRLRLVSTIHKDFRPVTVWQSEGAFWSSVRRRPHEVRWRASENSTGSVRFSGNGKWLAVSQSAKVIDIWRLADDPQQHFSVTGHGRICNFDFSNTGRWFATAESGVGVRLWNMDRGDTAKPVTFPEREAQWLAFTFDSDDSHVVTESASQSDRPGVTRRWIVATGQPEAVVRKAPRFTEGISEDGIWLLDSNPERRRQFPHTTDDGSVVHLLPDSSDAMSELALLGHSSRITAVAMSTDGARLATGDEGGHIRLWDLTQSDPGRTAFRLPIPDEAMYRLQNRQLTVGRLEFSPDSEQLIVQRINGADSRTLSAPIEIWNLSRDRLLRQSRQLAGRILTQEELRLYAIETGSQSE